MWAGLAGGTYVHGPSSRTRYHPLKQMRVLCTPVGTSYRAGLVVSVLVLCIDRENSEEALAGPGMGRGVYSYMIQGINVENRPLGGTLV